MSEEASRVGAATPGHGALQCLPVGRVLALVGGLALIAAYFMPWFGMQGISLTGSFLGQFLAGTNDLRRVLPGAGGGPEEVLLLRALVYLFPAMGATAAGLALFTPGRPATRAMLDVVLAVSGAIPLAAVVLGTSRLPPGSSQEVGLWFIAGGAVAVLLGAAADLLLSPKGPKAQTSGAQ